MKNDAVDSNRPIGVLLVNLGTPDAPTPKAVARYLREFLSDPRVVELPSWLWRPLLNWVIVPMRARSSAKKYASIWLQDDSPLRHYTALQAEALATQLGSRFKVRYAMRYGQPAVAQVLHEWDQAEIEQILVLPLYPQYAASTTASVFDAVFAALQKHRVQPALRTVVQYATEPTYIAALVHQIEHFWQTHGRPNFAQGERLLLSFHGLPKRMIARGDPYQRQCEQTTQAVRAALKLPAFHVLQSFQSRFGPAPWLEPYTSFTLQDLGRQRVSRVDVFCPGFTADCLETLEEICLEGQQLFQEAGGGTYHFIPCVNASPLFIAALAQLVRTHSAGWL